MVDDADNPLAPTQVEATATNREPESTVILPPTGYEIGELIGRGGMGEVMQAYDQRLGREVAIKRMRGARPTAERITRFLREARVQARLDHPAVVPVYELGTDAHGQPYFTMKRLSGVTLAQRLTRGGPIQPLLRALVDVCLAIELAHTRGIVHRDLKPENIMLGDYGEVYVLDWGVARVLTDDRRVPSQSEIDTLDDGTQTGAMLGTPGYMSPEQTKGLPATPAADVYALGAILFEILAGSSLHPRGTAAIASTLMMPQDSPATRCTDRAIAPELDEACQLALGAEPGDRPSARQLADKIQAYLDGDRDHERRRQLALDHLGAARAALASTDPEGRAIAVHRAGRALAIDPESASAAALVTALIVEPPADYPPALAASLVEAERKSARERARLATIATASTFVFLPFLPFVDVLSWRWAIALYAMMGFFLIHMRRASRTGTPNMPLTLVAALFLVLAWSRIAGPYMLTPLLVCGILLGLAPNRWLNPRPALVLGWLLAAVALPVVLEWVGVLSPTIHVYRDYIWSHSTIVRIEAGLGDALLLVANLVMVVVVGLFAVSIQRGARSAQRELQIQAWHLRHLIPTVPPA